MKWPTSVKSAYQRKRDHVHEKAQECISKHREAVDEFDESFEELMSALKSRKEKR